MGDLGFIVLFAWGVFLATLRQFCHGRCLPKFVEKLSNPGLLNTSFFSQRLLFDVFFRCFNAGNFQMNLYEIQRTIQQRLIF